MISLMSIWRNDAEKQIHQRVEHLLAKQAYCHTMRWDWAVGDSTDATEEILREYAAYDERIHVSRFDTGLPESDVIEQRRLRSATTASDLLATIPEDLAFVCWHESDLRSPRNVIDLLLAGSLPCAAWPIIKLPTGTQFYDFWAYRDLGGGHIFNAPDNQRFEVSAFGSLWLAQAELMRGRRMNEEACVSLCKQWRSEGVRLWADPRIIVEQPVDLWEAR